MSEAPFLQLQAPWATLESHLGKKPMELLPVSPRVTSQHDPVVVTKCLTPNGRQSSCVIIIDASTLPHRQRCVTACEVVRPLGHSVTPTKTSDCSTSWLSVTQNVHTIYFYFPIIVTPCHLPSTRSWAPCFHYTDLALRSSCLLVTRLMRSDHFSLFDLHRWPWDHELP